MALSRARWNQASRLRWHCGGTAESCERLGRWFHAGRRRRNGLTARALDVQSPGKGVFADV